MVATMQFGKMQLMQGLRLGIERDSGSLEQHSTLS